MKLFNSMKDFDDYYDQIHISHEKPTYITGIGYLDETKKSCKNKVLEYLKSNEKRLKNIIDLYDLDSITYDEIMTILLDTQSAIIKLEMCKDFK